MPEIQDNQVAPELSTDNNDSIVGRLRRAAQEAAEDKYTDIDIPGYGGELFCRYRLLSSFEIDQIVKRSRNSSGRSEQLMNNVLDNVITACEELCLRENGEDIPLRQHPEYDGDRDIPVRYDGNLARFVMLEIEGPPSARKVVLALFGNNDIAVSHHAAILSRWMMRSSSEIDELLGGA